MERRPQRVVVLTRPSTLYGLLANNVWSVTGDSKRASVNQMLLQPFYDGTLPHGLTLGFQSQSSANWEAVGNQKWTVPIGPTFTQLIKMGSGLGEIGGAAFWNVVHPYQSGNWTGRVVFTILQPGK
jgi:hypothetical protein